MDFEIVLIDRFKIIKKLAVGSFSEIFQCQDMKTGEQVAMKIEKVNYRSQLIPFEANMYQMLIGAPGIANMVYTGVYTNYNMLIIEMLGPNLFDLFRKCKRRFSLKTVLMLADSILERIEYLHSHHFMHRDIKPENFLMGRDKKKNQLYIIDFGLSKLFEDPHTHDHVIFTKKRSLTGTPRYASIRAMKGMEQSRRDDLESIAYMFIYFLKGTLPWIGLKSHDHNDNYRKILETKLSLTTEELCSGLPEEFEIFLKSAREMKFMERPNYSEYRAMFRNLFSKSGYMYDSHYDWYDVLPSVEMKKIPFSQPVTANISPRDKIPRKQITPIVHNHRLVPNFELSEEESRERKLKEMQKEQLIIKSSLGSPIRIPPTAQTSFPSPHHNGRKSTIKYPARHPI